MPNTIFKTSHIFMIHVSLKISSVHILDIPSLLARQYLKQMIIMTRDIKYTLDRNGTL